MEIKLGNYEHYKGNKYKIMCVGKHSETLEEFVVYRALYGSGDIWIRPANMFFENVPKDGKSVPRFKPVD